MQEGELTQDASTGSARSDQADFIVGMSDVIARALELVPADSHQAGHILCNHANAVGFTRDGYSEACEHFERALATARREPDLAVEMRILTTYGNIEGFHMHWEQCLEKSLRAIELGWRVEEPLSVLRARLWAAQSLYVRGEPERAIEHAMEGVRFAERLRDRLWMARQPLFAAAGALLRGD